jgi:protein-S-isoprenylcysteine O-methyltransferase Ste14
MRLRYHTCRWERVEPLIRDVCDTPSTRGPATQGVASNCGLVLLAATLHTEDMAPLLMLTLLPALTYYLWICLHDFDGALAPATASLLARIPLPTLSAVTLYGGFLALQIALYLGLPGRDARGPALADGSRLTYRLNGAVAFAMTLAVAALAVAATPLPATIASDQFGPLLTTANIAAFLLAGALLIHGRRAPDAISSGATLRDLVAGVALNPRLGRFDLKFFCEGRPSLILWALFNLSFVAAQWERHGRLTVPMLLVVGFQLLYVADAFLHEAAMLTTWDIKRERFGWMLAWGNLVWVPFVYSLQAHYLVDHVHEIGISATIVLVSLDLVGYAIFRGANLQKHRFRENPETLVWGRRPEVLGTTPGTRLLASGWWGLARHVNYLGDLLMGLAWCLPTGFRHPLPYVYVAFLAVLLVHRERRDHAACLAKYGQDWAAYCRRVPWRIIPGIY